MSCISLDSLLRIDESGIIDGDLAEFYTDYVLRRDALGEESLDPRDWMIRLPTDSAPHKRLVQIAGPDYKRTLGLTWREPVFVEFGAFPNPFQTPAALDSLRDRLSNAPALWDRLSVFRSDTAVREMLAAGRVKLGHLRILKGNIGEILSLPDQLRILDAYRSGEELVSGNGQLARSAFNRGRHPNAQLFSGVRVRNLSGALGDTLFSDNVVGVLEDGGLRLLAVVEVKASRRGGSEALEQVFEWGEARLEENLSIVLTAGGRTFRSADAPPVLREQELSFLYRPTPVGSDRTGLATGVQSADRIFFQPPGTSTVGLDANDSRRIASARSRFLLPQSSSEIDFLVRDTFERLRKGEISVPP